jgi:hypothetical protein
MSLLGVVNAKVIATVRNFFTHTTIVHAQRPCIVCCGRPACESREMAAVHSRANGENARTWYSRTFVGLYG